MNREQALKNELIERINWLIKLRWIAIVGVFATVFTTSHYLKVVPDSRPLYLIALSMGIYNFFFREYARAISSKSLKTIRRNASLHIIFDLVVLTLLLHFAGGVENPFLFYFVFHLVIGSILLPKKVSYILAALNTCLLGSLILLETYGILPHYHLQNFLPENLWRDWLYISSVLFVFTTTIFFSVYFATSIVEDARKREEEIFDLKDDLEAKIAERTRLEGQLLQSEKMSAIGELAAGLAHEINNPLDGIQNCISRIKRNPKNIAQTQEYLDLMSDALKRIETTVRQLLDFSRKQKLALQEVELNQVIEEVIALTEYSANEKHIEIKRDLEMGLPPVLGDRHLLQQVFLNLILNAFASMPQGGTLTLRTSILEGLEGLEGENPMLGVEVIDTGIGIPESEIDKIFVPFYTTKNPGEGTGLGLSVSDNIIRQHGGVIEVKSELGKGSNFTVKLPLSVVSGQ